MMYLRAIFLLVLLSTFSCLKEPACPSEQFEGDYPLGEEAKTYNPYDTENAKAIFKNEMGEEFSFSIQNVDLITTSGNIFPGACPEDPSQTVALITSGTYFLIDLKSENLALDFQINIANEHNPAEESIPTYVEGDRLAIIAFSDQLVSGRQTVLYHRIDQMDVDGNPVDHTDNSSIQDTLSLLNYEYYDVIVNNDTGFVTDPDYTVYYNKSKGLVGFRIEDTGAEFALDRIEN